MGGHGHEPPYKIPDASIYKVENIPILVKLQEKLAKKGLKDPWIRNYAWRYSFPGSPRVRTLNFIFRGYKVGIPLFLLTIGTEYALGIDYHHHEDHDDHGSHEHH